MLASARALHDNPVFVDRLSGYALDVADLESLYKEFAAIIKRGDTLGADVSLLKIFASETFRASLNSFSNARARPVRGPVLRNSALRASTY